MSAHLLRRVLVIGCAFAALSVLSGCTIAKQAYYEYRGAKAEVLLNRDLDEDALGSYQGVEFEPVTTRLSPTLCPPALSRFYDDRAMMMHAELLDAFPGGEPTLYVHSELQYFQAKGLLGAGWCLARIELRGESGLVADGIVCAESKSFRAGGEQDLAEACVVAVGQFLRTQKLGPEADQQNEPAEEDAQPDDERVAKASDAGT